MQCQQFFISLSPLSPSTTHLPHFSRLLKAPTSTNKTVTPSTTRQPSQCFYSGFPRWPRSSSAGWQGDCTTFVPVGPRTSSGVALEVCWRAWWRCLPPRRRRRRAASLMMWKVKRLSECVKNIIQKVSITLYYVSVMMPSQGDIWLAQALSIFLL